MKRIITFSVILMALIFTVIGVIKEENSDATFDVSSGLCVIAAQYDMAKSTQVDNKIVFSADDFEKNLNISEVSSITVTSVPAVSDGCLCVGDVLVNAGQTISRSNLDLLNYRAGNENVKEASFKFKVNGSEYEMTCNMYFLTHENSAPTLSMEDERLFSVSTHQTIAVYGKVGAYDRDGDTFRYEIVTYAKNGVLDFDSKTGEYSYTPIGAYFGEDYFEYVAVDKYGNYSSSRRVSLTVEKLKTDVVYFDMADHPSHNAAIAMTEAGVMNGNKIGEITYFMPDKSVSRIDFLVMLMHAVGIKDVEAVLDTGFDDDGEIPASMKGYVRHAVNMGLVHGSVGVNGEYIFEPNRAITRAEAALIVSNLVEGSVPTVKPTFADKNDIPAWAHDAIYTLNDLGLLNTINGEISANSDITRSQLADMLYALMNLLK